MNSRLMSIIRKEFIQIFRDPRTLALILVMPIIQLFLLGYAATTDVRNVPIVVWDQSRSPESRALMDAFRAADYFDFAYEVHSQYEIQTSLSRAKYAVRWSSPPIMPVNYWKAMRKSR